MVQLTVCEVLIMSGEPTLSVVTQDGQQREAECTERTTPLRKLLGSFFFKGQTTAQQYTFQHASDLSPLYYLFSKKIPNVKKKNNALTYVKNYCELNEFVHLSVFVFIFYLIVKLFSNMSLML